MDDKQSESAYHRVFSRDVMILGDLVKSTLLVEGRDDYLVAHESGGKRIDQFAYITGAVAMEFIVQSCVEYIHIRGEWEQGRLPAETADAYAKSEPFSYPLLTERRVFGPSNVETGKTAQDLAAIARVETIRIGLTDAGTEQEGYRQIADHGGASVGSPPPASAINFRWMRRRMTS